MIAAIFWDVGGVLLSNAWDHTERAEALAHFELSEAEFKPRHDAVVSAFEQGEMALDEYLNQTIFYEERPFSKETFREYMYSLSQPKPEVLEFARDIATSNKYLMGTINNESRELNLYRIERFGLKEVFRVFVSSCFVGMRKPQEGIYRMAVELTQMSAEDCCFIDDRAENLAIPDRMGMKTIQMRSVEHLREELAGMGVTA